MKYISSAIAMPPMVCHMELQSSTHTHQSARTNTTFNFLISKFQISRRLSCIPEFGYTAQFSYTKLSCTTIRCETHGLCTIPVSPILYSTRENKHKNKEKTKPVFLLCDLRPHWITRHPSTYTSFAYLTSNQIKPIEFHPGDRFRFILSIFTKFNKLKRHKFYKFAA